MLAFFARQLELEIGGYYYKVLGRPYLEYEPLFWSPYLKKGIQV